MAIPAYHSQYSTIRRPSYAMVIILSILTYSTIVVQVDSRDAKPEALSEKTHNDSQSRCVEFDGPHCYHFALNSHIQPR